LKRVIAFTGFSGSGKTTLVERLIPRLIEAYGPVAAIKHTHHPLNFENRGDTARFRAAGADPVVLAGEGEGVVFHSAGDPYKLRFTRPDDIPPQLAPDVIVVEGFKTFDLWPRIEIDAERRITTDEALARIDRIWRS
jgi:molybdopterin-guanine dinucleotide biosynthesis protein B